MTDHTLMCATCGESPRAHWRIVCADCANADRRLKRQSKSVSRDCVECGLTIPSERYRALTCSTKCSYKRKRAVAGIGNYDAHYEACLTCGGQFWKTQSNRKYCSQRCLIDMRRRERQADPALAKAHRDSSKRWADGNREKLRESGRVWRANNKDAHNRMSREWYYRNKHRQVPSWRSRNPELHAAKERKRQAMLRAATPFLIPHATVEARLDIFGGVCWICGSDADTVDHVKPIAAGGLNIPANMRPACRSCNSSKSDTWYGVDRLSDLVSEVLGRRINK